MTRLNKALMIGNLLFGAGNIFFVGFHAGRMEWAPIALTIGLINIVIVMLGLALARASGSVTDE
jgi:branched-subunit amino acid permease